MQQDNPQIRSAIEAEIATLMSVISYGYRLAPTCYLFFDDGFWLIENWQDDQQVYLGLAHNLVHRYKPKAFALFYTGALAVKT